VGLPRRNLGRLASVAPLSDAGGFGPSSGLAAGLDPAGDVVERGDGLLGGADPVVDGDPAGLAPVEGAGAAAGCEGDESAGLVKRGGSSPDPEPLDGAGPEAGFVFAAEVCSGRCSRDGSRVRRGGWSLVSIPTGTIAAVWSVSAFSLPAGAQAPVASHGLRTFGALLCSALPTVNRPRELPVRKAS